MIASRRCSYSPRGGVFNGPLVTDNGFWDTYRTVYPLLSLVYPDHLAAIVNGWINAFKEGGWLPKWASPGYRDSMVSPPAASTLFSTTLITTTTFFILFSSCSSSSEL